MANIYTAEDAAADAEGEEVMSELDRPATNPGGMVCEDCSEVFIGEAWHSWCAICVAVRRTYAGAKSVQSADIATPEGQTSTIVSHEQ